jgi:DNA-directed RNA polymerase subunit K/omega
MTTRLDRLPSLVRVAARRARKMAKRLHACVALVYLRLRNLVARGAATGSAPVVVSLTTYGERIHTVSVAIESIARGKVRPQRLLLWLDSREQIEARPESLRRLERRGVEILLTANYGPHTKYYPFVQSLERHHVPLVTSDDDVIYPSNWLARLMSANEQHREAISGHWISIMGISGDRVADYATWVRAHDTAVRPTNFALGVSGVIYPPAMLEELKRRGDGFVAACPGADDLWLKWVALRAGIPVRQVGPVPHHFPIIPRSQKQSLMQSNVGENRNDHWIRGLYSAEDLAALSNSAASHQLD